MTASLETLVVAAYVFAASLPIPRPGPEGKITDAELIALAVAQAAMGESSDRKFLGLIAYRLPGWFAHLPDQTQYNRRLRRLVPQITTVQLAIAELIAEGPRPPGRRHLAQLRQLDEELRWPGSFGMLSESPRPVGARGKLLLRLLRMDRARAGEKRIGVLRMRASSAVRLHRAKCTGPLLRTDMRMT
jgi:hypothetical protein